MRPLVKPGVPLPKMSPYPGHYAVVRSLVEGLRAIDADFNFNPRRTADLARVVYAPENASLRQAAALKRRGRIDYLVAGPVNALFPDEADSVLQLPEIDRLIVASEWVHGLYGETPKLLEKSVACPCGIDARYWHPSGQPRMKTALVYWKSGDEAFCEQVERIVRACGLEPRRLRAAAGEHALFGPDEYRQLLDESQLAVFLSAFETQGLALVEAWSMDVPTAVWDPQGEAEWRGKTFQAGSSAPYLTPVTGRRWRSLDELEPVLHEHARGPGRVSTARLGARAHDRRDLRACALRHHSQRRRRDEERPNAERVGDGLQTVAHHQRHATIQTDD